MSLELTDSLQSFVDSASSQQGFVSGNEYVLHVLQKEREAAARAAEARERSRLNGLCPIYYLARQTCANAGNGYQQCMSIRVGRSYSSWDDSTCFNR